MKSVKFWKQRLRLAPYSIPQYPWDPKISVGLGPPTSVVVTGFDPITSESQIGALFGSYGEIQAIENQTDPNTGSFIGVCLVRYKDSRSSRGPAISAVEAARKAEKQGSGQRIGLRHVKVERDGSGRKCRRYVQHASKRNLEKRAKELELEDKKKAPPPPPPPSHSDAMSPNGAPPPNAPKGPSKRAITKIPEGPKNQAATKRDSLVEQEPIINNIKRQPYIFVDNSFVPVMSTTIPHLQKRLKMYRWKEVRCDRSGYFILFEDSKRGEDEAVRCYEGANRTSLFDYTMEMECQQYGNPKYERSPSPARAALEERKKEELQREQNEDLLDIEEEKRLRALDIHPVKTALLQLQDELKERVMSDIKTRTAAPALYDYLEPSRHVERRQRLGISDPSDRPMASTYLSVANERWANRTPGHRGGMTGTFGRRNVARAGADMRDAKERHSTSNVYADERRKRPTQRRADIMSLHHRLNDFYSRDESDDEDRRSSREETKGHDSRSLSRMSSVAPSAVGKEDDHNRRPSSKHGPAPDEESGDDDYGIAKSVLDPHLLKKEPEDMALRELHLITLTLPSSSRLHKHAKKEIGIRQRNSDDDRLFHIKSEGVEEPRVEDAGIVDEIAGLESTIEEIVPSLAKPKKKTKEKKKSKKHLFEERQAAKTEAVSAKALLQAEAAPTPETPSVDEAAVEKIEQEEEEEEEEEPRAEVEWRVSTLEPKRTVEDDPDLVLDVDGWQDLLKDNEDLSFLKTALKNETTAQILDVNTWVIRQKQIKSLNSVDNSHEPPSIHGYYVPNSTGSARTEGVNKIRQSEKSKYLPHHIQVAEARQRRQTAAAKSDISAAAEAARKAKMASNATSRSNRVNNRTQVKDLNTVKQNLQHHHEGGFGQHQQGDAIRFNQLKKRKKLVRFDRSAIHGWGLYAEENIAPSDMIIEYVGEKVRQAVANIREMKYDKQGMGSSYLFRIDEDTIVDATKKGGIARFINHSCAPNCTAKIIKVDGEKRIVIYALKDVAKSEYFALYLLSFLLRVYLLPQRLLRKLVPKNRAKLTTHDPQPTDEELTYDYKFERELGNSDRIPCLCGAETCKGFLN